MIVTNLCENGLISSHFKIFCNSAFWTIWTRVYLHILHENSHNKKYSRLPSCSINRLPTTLWFLKIGDACLFLLCFSSFETGWYEFLFLETKFESKLIFGFCFENMAVVISIEEIQMSSDCFCWKNTWKYSIPCQQTQNAFSLWVFLQRNHQLHFNNF